MLRVFGFGARFVFGWWRGVLGFMVPGGCCGFWGCCNTYFGCLVFVVGGIGFWFLMYYLC